uniref:Uncharacterized protein n=1 Tax=Anopheles atroparvus TaxID=41427 RepID=A0AAG5D0Q2_ANOAO
MSEPKSFAVKKDSKETKNKQYNEGSAFSNIADDGLLTGPSVKTAEDATLLSDDENKTLTMLEPPKKPSGRDCENVGLPALTPLTKKPGRDDAKHTMPTAVVKSPANPVQPKKSLLKPIVTTRDLLKTLKEQTKTSKPPPVELPSKEGLLQKMRERLSKQIEIKSTSAATPATPTKEMDTSGAIEIPQDLILSSEIPATSISSIDTKETELEDHDLIAILEGNDVEIRENATEIEVCVGTSASAEGIGEMEIYFVDQDEVQKAKKEREKEIARRQMESLPKYPKKRVTATKASAKPTPADELPSAKATGKGTPAEAAKQPVQDALSKIPPGVTIKGQTTIRPVEAKSSAGMPTKEEKVPKEKHSTGRVAKAAKEIAGRTSSPVVQPTKISPAKMKSPPVSPQTPTKSTELVDSLVSDWDDEPVGSQQAAAVKEDKSNTAKEDSKPIVTSVTVEEAAPEDVKFATPMLPVAGEPRRVIKKKIIWDPSDATVPFSVLVKSNRGNAPASQAPLKENPILGSMRRKRADSVAVRMFDVPSRAAPKRALTPEPVRVPLPEPEPSETVAENNNITGTKALLDAKSKKRKKNEIERLLADEGAINMLYEIECEASQKDLLKNTAVDTNDEDEKLLAKTKIITDAVINQGKSPTEGTSQQGLRVRAKRAVTPSNPQASASVDPAIPKSDAGGGEVSPNTTRSSPVAVKKSNNGPANTVLTGARKRKNPSTFKDWDFVYNAQGGDDAMIIRRRSNSSYSSSCASPRRLSVDQSFESSTGASSSATKPPKQEQIVDDSFLFAKPTKPATAAPEELQVDPSLLANMRGKLTKALKNIKGDPAEPTAKKTGSPPNATNSTVPKQPQAKRKVTTKVAPVSPVLLGEVSTSGEYVVSPSGELVKQVDRSNETVETQLKEMKQISGVLNGEYVEIVLKTKGVVASGVESASALNDVFSMEAMTELTEVFTLLEKQPRVTAVLLMSAGDHFSRGIDLGHLVQPIHKRKASAEEMGECLKSFLKALISFSKPIVAAVHGDVLGMGVTILPVFDIVLAQTGSSFTTPYGTLGYLPEAMKAFTSCRTLKPKALSDLLLQGKRLTTAAALDYGLVTEMIPADRFSERARALVKKVASQSAQAMQSIKQHQRREFLSKLDFVLTLEQKKHTQQWITVECQQKFKLFVSKEGELGKMS